MSIIAPTVYATIEPIYRKNISTPQLVIGRWFGQVITTGDASGGNVQMSVLLSQVSDFFGGNVLFNVEEVCIYNSVYFATQSGEVQISDGNPACPSTVFSVSGMPSLSRYGNGIHLNAATQLRHSIHRAYTRSGGSWGNGGVTVWTYPNTNATVYVLAVIGLLLNEDVFNGIDSLPIIQIPK